MVVAGIKQEVLPSFSWFFVGAAKRRVAAVGAGHSLLRYQLEIRELDRSVQPRWSG